MQSVLPQSKETTALGNHLYLVEGSVRWGLYDLQTETVTLLDEESGTFLNELAKLSLEPDQKRAFLSENAPLIWQKADELGICTRLFEPDSSVGPSGIPLDLLWLEVTDICNERCVHCYAESGPERTTSMSVELAREIISQAHEQGFRKLQFVGGEPFAHRSLRQMVEYAHGLGFPEIEIFTNLTIPKEHDLAHLKTLGIKIATSLLGPNPEVHDACTRTPRSFERWYRNIKLVQELGIPYRIGVVRMRQNQDLMSAIEQFLRAEDLLKPGEPFEPDDLRPTGRGDGTTVFPTTLLDHGLFLTITPNFFHQSRHYNPCWRGEIAVATDGAVYPCVFSRSFSVGNLNNQTLSDLLDQLKQSYWSITLDQVDQCRGCELRNACMDCRALSLNSGRGLYGGPVRCSYDPYH